MTAPCTHLDDDLSVSSHPGAVELWGVRPGWVEFTPLQALAMAAALIRHAAVAETSLVTQAAYWAGVQEAPLFAVAAE